MRLLALLRPELPRAVSTGVSAVGGAPARAATGAAGRSGDRRNLLQLLWLAPSLSLSDCVYVLPPSLCLSVCLSVCVYVLASSLCFSVSLSASTCCIQFSREQVVAGGVNSPRGPADFTRTMPLSFAARAHFRSGRWPAERRFPRSLRGCRRGSRKLWHSMPVLPSKRMRSEIECSTK